MSGPRVTVAGPVLALPGNVDTDTIIKSRHCVSLEPRALGPHCLAELAGEPPFRPGRYPVLACAGVFGTGSARVQAPIALAAAGVRVVLARAIAPIFLESCINGAYLLALRCPDLVPPPSGERVRVEVGGGEVLLERADGSRRRWPCALPDWVLAGTPWLELLERRARAAGGLAALRAAGPGPG